MVTRGHWRSWGSKVRRILRAGPLRSLIGWAVGSGGKLSSSCRMGRSDAFLLGTEGGCVFPFGVTNNALRAGELSLQSPSQLQLELFPSLYPGRMSVPSSPR